MTMRIKSDLFATLYSLLSTLYSLLITPNYSNAPCPIPNYQLPIIKTQHHSLQFLLIPMSQLVRRIFLYFLRLIE